VWIILNFYQQFCTVVQCQTPTSWFYAENCLYSRINMCVELVFHVPYSPAKSCNILKVLIHSQSTLFLLVQWNPHWCVCEVTQLKHSAEEDLKWRNVTEWWLARECKNCALTKGKHTCRDIRWWDHCVCICVLRWLETCCLLKWVKKSL
jgi:hypothetical protein